MRSIDQDFEIQQQRLRAEGCVIVRAEKISGASRDCRTELATIIEFLRESDELIVTLLDRLDQSQCEGNSASFEEGCQSYVQHPNRGSDEDYDGNEIDGE